MEAKLKSSFDIFDDCDTIRRKSVLASRVKVTHFLKWINMTSNSYGRFMAQKGLGGGSSKGNFDTAFIANPRISCAPGRYISFEEKGIAERKETSPSRLERESMVRRKEDEVVSIRSKGLSVSRAHCPKRTTQNRRYERSVQWISVASKIGTPRSTGSRNY